MGKVVVSYLSAIEKILPKAIVVSDGHREDYKYITVDGVCFPIIELSSLSLTQDRSSAVFINTAVSAGETVIDITTIDKLLETGVIPRVDYIKADIEGAERDMLRGAVNAMRDYSPKLAICTYHYAEDRELLEAIIKKANPRYVVEHKWRKLFAYVPE